MRVERDKAKQGEMKRRKETYGEEGAKQRDIRAMTSLLTPSGGASVSVRLEPGTNVGRLSFRIEAYDMMALLCVSNGCIAV